MASFGENNGQEISSKINSTIDESWIVVIGASSGGFEALQKLVSGLPADFQPPVFIVWHMSADLRGILPNVLNRCNTVPAAHAYDGEPIRHNRIYIAPPDRHMIIEAGKLRVARGPKENRFRPAIDPLFRSAAYEYGNKAIGVVLTGALDDGSSGLWTIKSRNGIAIVQDPFDAEVPSMPKSALNAVKVDHSVPVAEIPELLVRLTRNALMPGKVIPMENEERLKLEINIAAEANAFHSGLLEYGDFTAFTCPECHGVLSAYKEGGRLRYRCHTGHAFSADSLLSALTEDIDNGLYNAMRGMEESILLLNMIGDDYADSNHSRLAALYFQKAKEADERLQLIRRSAYRHEQLSKDTLEAEADETAPGNEVSEK